MLFACFSPRMVCDRPRCPGEESRFRRAGGIKYKSVHIGAAVGKRKPRIPELPASRPRKMVPSEFFMLLPFISRSCWKSTFGR
jgi:hypothetical protein